MIKEHVIAVTIFDVLCIVYALNNLYINIQPTRLYCELAGNIFIFEDGRCTDGGATAHALNISVTGVMANQNNDVVEKHGP